MPSETLPPPLLDAIKASASKMKEKQSALDARTRELDALRARLDADRAELETRMAKLTADQEALAREREGLDDVRATMERDLAAINEGRDKIAHDEERLQKASRALEAREAAVNASEERVTHLERAFTERIRESESNLRGLLERGEDLIKVQASWLSTFEAQEKELHAIGEELRGRQGEFALQRESLAGLKDALDEELRLLITERENLATKEKSILEAETYLASTLQVEGVILSEETPTPPPAPPVQEPIPPPSAPEPAPAPVPQPESARETEPTPSPVAVAPSEDTPPEPQAAPHLTKGEATERLARAVDAWKRARDAGWRVTDIRKTVKGARDAIEAGDYERAVQMSTEILDQLQASVASR